MSSAPDHTRKYSSIVNDGPSRAGARSMLRPVGFTEEDFKKHINPHSLEIVTAKLEFALAGALPDERYQFERLGYFTLDAKDSTPTRPVFNRTITLKDTWAKK